MARIAIVGATGFTGGLVAEALAARRAALRLIGRAAPRLDRSRAALPPSTDSDARVIGEWTEASIAQAIDGCGAVISCAGPFVRAGGAVVRAAIRARIPYCDSTGEQSFIREVFDGLDAPARGAGIALVPAAGYDYVPGDLGCALAAEGAGPLERLDVTYASESGASSAGTRRTMIEILAAPMVERIDDEVRPMRIAEHRKRIETPFGAIVALSFPGGESIMAPRHVDVRSVRSFIGTRRPPRGVALLPAVRRLVRLGPVRRLVQKGFAARGPHGPNRQSRARRFVCQVESWPVDGPPRTVRLEAADPYGFTGNALAELALRMAAGRVPGTGVLTPAQAVAPHDFLAALDVTVAFG